jgi:hypothetical protein
MTLGDVVLDAPPEYPVATIVNESGAWFSRHAATAFVTDVA